MAERLPDRDPQPGLEDGWEVCLSWASGAWCVAEVFDSGSKASEECDVRNKKYPSARHTWSYRYRPGWVGEEASDGSRTS